jgi:hypothetical protein
MVPLVLDPERLPPTVLEELHRTLREELAESLDAIVHPRGAVLDAASLVTAKDLVLAAMAVLDRPGAREPRALAAEANLAYATMLAAIDLLKSHTAVPRVPPPRPLPASSSP